MATGDNQPHRKRVKDAATLVAPCVSAVTGGHALSHAMRPLAQAEKDSLSRALGTDVDAWRAEFSTQLRATSSRMLAALDRDLEELEPHNRAYALDVLIRNAALIEGRNLVHASSVNIQVNNYGETSREQLIASLEGTKATALDVPRRTIDSPTRQDFRDAREASPNADATMQDAAQPSAIQAAKPHENPPTSPHAQ